MTCLPNSILSDNYTAILMNNSKYYYNYRMVSNLLSLYNNLKSIGYTDREIQIQNNQCTYNLPANIPPGFQRIEDDNISENLVKPHMRLDLNMEDVSLKRHIMSVANRHEQYDSLNKRYEPVDSANSREPSRTPTPTYSSF